MNRLLVVTNASAGTADDESVAAAVEVLRDGADVRVAASSGPEELDDLLGGREGRTPVLVGGDGSLHAAVGALVRRGELSPDEPLGLIPLGTGNDLARAVGIPLDPAEAARALLSGLARPPRRMELMLDDAGGVVVNAVHLGIGAEAAARGEAWKPRLGKAAYALGGVVAGARTTGWRLRVEADDRVVVDMDRKVLMVGLGLGTSIGGGAPLAPDADPSDGLVDLVVSESVGPVARIGYGAGLRRGSHVDRADVTHLRARRVVVTGEPFPVNADGELSGPVTARTWAVEHERWSLVVPG